MRRLALLLLAFAACGASNDAAGPDAAGPGDGGADVTTAALSCASYCATIQAACTADIQQYSDMADCMNSCAAFPVGAASDTSGDTLGCRTTFAKKAATSAAMAKAECTHAGPGGDGVCGDNCSGYCDIAMMYCTDANMAKLYDTRAQCMSDCARRATDMKLDTGTGPRTDMGNEVACLLYHAQMGSVVPGSHCLGDLAITDGSCL
ncbi:MAG TPA: hypothetical protein VK989_07265 [Polyangia bacterium]|jgi:hypothetical protein|nr:hypothetical protein [Polyangia bacterium]